MLLSFALDQSRFGGVWCLLQRDHIPGLGEIEGGFFENTSVFERFIDTGFLDSLNALVQNPEVEWVVVSRNSRTIFDEHLLNRVDELFKRISPIRDHVALMSGGGLGLNNEYYCSLYSSHEPFIQFGPSSKPICDAMTDLYIVSAQDVRSFCGERGAGLDDIFELGLIVEGYVRHGRISLYVPELAAGVDGKFRRRDISLLCEQVKWVHLPIASGVAISTLEGRLVVPGGLPMSDDLGRKVPHLLPSVKDASEKAVQPFLDNLTISIVTRTQFRRLFLLRRLLASITRARVDAVPIEVVLSTDLDADAVNKFVGKLRAEFPELKINYVVNDKCGHSRVTNLLGGVESASGEYIWVMDDDDYVDIFAFKNIQKAFFYGSRPLIVGDSLVHEERWDLSNVLFPVLAESKISNEYPGVNWKRMFGGVNHLPICASIMPRSFLVSRISHFKFEFDFSEDYALFLLLLGAPDLPEVVNLGQTIAHISIRYGHDNTVTQPDRTQWTRDILGNIYNLLYASKDRNRACWASLVSSHIDPSEEGRKFQVEKLQASLAIKDAQIDQLNREVERLRELVNFPPEQEERGGSARVAKRTFGLDISRLLPK